MNKERKEDFERIIDAMEYFHSGAHTVKASDNPLLADTHRLISETDTTEGITPKQFAQLLSLEYAKEVIRQSREELYQKGVEGGVKGPANSAVANIILMTNEEYNNQGKNLSINYYFSDSRFGPIITAATAKGLCYLAFFDGTQEEAFARLSSQFPDAIYNNVLDTIQQNALILFREDWDKLQKIQLHVKGTLFQLKVWEALLQIPMGDLSTYSTVAEMIDNPNASRAVGTAIGNNPVAFLIPCHRVVKSNGEFGEYHWGNLRKAVIIGWEAGKVYAGKDSLV